MILEVEDHQTEDHQTEDHRTEDHQTEDHRTEDHQTEDRQTEETLNFTLQLVLSVKKRLKYHSSPQGKNLFIAESVFKNKNHKMALDK